MKNFIKTFCLMLACMPVTMQAQEKIKTIDLDNIPTGELRPIQVIDDMREPLFFNFLANITYDPYEHKIYLADGDHLLVLAPDGKVIKKVGRRGQGPGEFGLIRRIALDKDHVFIADAENARVQILNKDFSYFRSVPVNGAVRDIACLGNTQLIIHASISMGKILYRYDLEMPYRPVESFLDAMPKFEKIPGNAWTINGVNITADSDCVYVLYRTIPLLRIFCHDTKDYQEVCFSGKAVEALYQKLSSGIKATPGAIPMKTFATRILIGKDGWLYWLCVIKGHTKIFVFDPSLQMQKAYSLELPQEASNKGKAYTDFSVFEDTLYLLNAIKGSIQVYQFHEVQ